jgi:DNA repair exonuclease SbcCD ATPase subunit
MQIIDLRDVEPQLEPPPKNKRSVFMVDDLFVVDNGDNKINATDSNASTDSSPRTTATSSLCVNIHGQDDDSSDEEGTTTSKGSRKKNRKNPPLICGLTFPVFGLIAGCLFLSFGAAIFFMAGWLEVPSLHHQIEDLEAEVSRLLSQVDQLESVKYQFVDSNQELNVTVHHLSVMNSDLHAKATQLERDNTKLNATNQAYGHRIDELVEQNTDYASQTEELSVARTDLASALTGFRLAVATMILDTAALANLNEALVGVAGSLSNIQDDPDMTLAALKLTLSQLYAQNTELESLNTDMVTILNFANHESTSVGDSPDKIAKYLAKQIATNRNLAEQSLESTYRQRVTSWDCQYPGTTFADQAFVKNVNKTMTSDEFALVLPYAEQLILSELCLQTADFAIFIQDTYPGGWTTSLYGGRFAVLLSHARRIWTGSTSLV